TSSISTISTISTLFRPYFDPEFSISVSCIVPGLNIPKSWQYINYERTGHIKKGRPPSWYTTLANHISQNPPSTTKTPLSNVHKPLSHKKNKLQWTYDFSSYGKLSFGRIVKKSHPTKNSQIVFYSHWIPLD